MIIKHSKFRLVSSFNRLSKRLKDADAAWERHHDHMSGEKPLDDYDPDTFDPALNDREKLDVTHALRDMFDLHGLNLINALVTELSESKRKRLELGAKLKQMEETLLTF